MFIRMIAVFAAGVLLSACGTAQVRADDRYADLDAQYRVRLAANLVAQEDAPASAEQAEDTVPGAIGGLISDIGSSAYKAARCVVNPVGFATLALSSMAGGNSKENRRWATAGSGLGCLAEARAAHRRPVADNPGTRAAAARAYQHVAAAEQRRAECEAANEVYRQYGQYRKVRRCR